jgi:hypothetical protein
LQPLSTGQQPEFKTRKNQMPAGATSLNPWLGLVNSALTAAQYKAGIDSDSSIAGNVAGQFSVYPNSPVGLSVLVDTGFDSWSVPSGYEQNAGLSSPALVTLTAPTTNPYWAMIYFDPNTNLCGVVYGVQATTPTPTFPDSWGVWPLALIQLGVGQTTVTASQIRDIRGLRLTQLPWFLELAVSGSTTLNLMGVRKIHIHIVTTANFTLTLNNVSFYTDIDIIAQASTVSKTMFVNAVTPSGVTLLCAAGAPGWAQTLAGTPTYGGINITTGGAGVSLGTGGIPAASICLRSCWIPGATPPVLMLRKNKNGANRSRRSLFISEAPD